MSRRASSYVLVALTIVALGAWLLVPPDKKEFLQALKAQSVSSATGLDDAVHGWFLRQPCERVAADGWTFNIETATPHPSYAVAYATWYQRPMRYGMDPFVLLHVAATPDSMVAQIATQLGIRPQFGVRVPRERGDPVSLSWADTVGDRYDYLTGLPATVRDRRAGLRFALVPSGITSRGRGREWIELKHSFYMACTNVPNELWLTAIGTPPPSPLETDGMTPLSRQQQMFLERVECRLATHDEWEYACAYFVSARPVGFDRILENGSRGFRLVRDIGP